jgi:hypothetical protein
MSTAALHERQRLQAEITRLYEMQPQCIIQHAFEVPLQDRHMHYGDTLFAWLVNHKDNILTSHQAWRQKGPLRQRDIRRFFTPISNHFL